MLGLPFMVIAEKFPIWNAAGGILSALGGGSIVMLVIAFFTFKKYILAFAAEKLGAISAGVSLLLLWVTLSVVCVALGKSATLLNDLTTIFVWSAVGSAVGVVMQIAARLIKERNNERAE
jgi:hypothetical protein